MLIALRNGVSLIGLAEPIPYRTEPLVQKSSGVGVSREAPGSS